MLMTVHTLKYIHKRHGFCKADITPVRKTSTSTRTTNTRTSSTTKPKITEDAVNDYQTKS